jgi:hypothetical protein
MGTSSGKALIETIAPIPDNTKDSTIDQVESLMNAIYEKCKKDANEQQTQKQENPPRPVRRPMSRGGNYGGDCPKLSEILEKLQKFEINE